MKRRVFSSSRQHDLQNKEGPFVGQTQYKPSFNHIDMFDVDLPDRDRRHLVRQPFFFYFPISCASRFQGRGGSHKINPVYVWSPERAHSSLVSAALFFFLFFFFFFIFFFFFLSFLLFCSRSFFVFPLFLKFFLFYFWVFSSLAMLFLSFSYTFSYHLIILLLVLFLGT